MTDARGATAVEYGLIIALIALGSLTALNAMANGDTDLWTTVSRRTTEERTIPSAD